jgi:DNA-binding NarL/FixJ family response regulator
MIRVAIVEDDKDTMQYLQATVQSSDEMNLVASFEDAESFLKKFDSLTADVVLMDINLPGKSGIQAVMQCKPRHPQLQFLMCTIMENKDLIFDSLCAGASGYLLKSESVENILGAIKQIHEGGSPMSAKIARKVVMSFQEEKKNAADVGQLSKREWEVLEFLDKGFRYKEIAEKLSISITTVQGYVRTIYEKLQVHSRTDALNKIFRR